MQVQADLSRLQTMIVVPEGVVDARWIVKPVGVASAAPGPTDYTLVAWLALAKGSTGLSALGPQLPARPTPLPEAELLLPSDVLATLPQDSGRRVLTGPSYCARSFERMPWQARRAVGVVVWMHTM